MFDKKNLYLENISVKSWPALWSLFYEICHLIYYKIELFIIFSKYESVCVQCRGYRLFFIQQKNHLTCYRLYKKKLVFIFLKIWCFFQDFLCLSCLFSDLSLLYRWSNFLEFIIKHLATLQRFYCVRRRRRRGFNLH